MHATIPAMLKRIFADNFRALVNFELRPDRLSLLLGRNGSGKTSVFNVLGTIYDLIVLGRSVNELLAFTKTRWDTRDVQRFELDIEGGGGEYRYILEIQHPAEPQGRPFIRSETVTFEGSPLYRFVAGQAQLYREDQEEGTTFPFRADQSYLPNLDSQGARQMQRLAGFKDLMAGLRIVQPNPFDLDLATQQDNEFLVRSGKNFASFVSYLTNEHPEVRTDLMTRFAEALPGFSNLLLKRGGDTKLLFAKFSEENRSPEYSLLDLSEGQRVLMILYAAVYGLLREGVVLCFDEPDNFISLAEIQPWLQVLRDLLEERGGQVMLISHHPEVIDYLALDSLYWFERPAGPVIVRPLEVEDDSPLKLSEIIAGGL